MNATIPTVCVSIMNANVAQILDGIQIQTTVNFSFVIKTSIVKNLIGIEFVLIKVDVSVEKDTQRITTQKSVKGFP
jgi:hypothetical protein